MFFNSFEVKEIIVYQTTTIKHSIQKLYNGILFFSPSGVESFFCNNQLTEKTILFAIGNTTAKEIKKHSDNQIVISDEPGKEKLASKMIDFFNPQELAKEVIKLAGNASERNRLGQNARNFAVQNYDLQTICLPKQLKWVVNLMEKKDQLAL